jgi:two-component system response regulator
LAETIVLLVEDNLSDAELARRALRRATIPVEVEIAVSGEAALERLLPAAPTDAPLPALVLLDLKLPGMTGLEVLRRIRQNPATRRLPVVILTSSLEERDLAASYDLGANSYVRKPVDFVQFAEATRHILEYWIGLNQPPPPERAVTALTARSAH